MPTDHPDFQTPEFEIVVSRFGNIGVFRRYRDGHLRFWAYERTIPKAIENFKHWNVTIRVQGPNTPVYEPPTI